MTRRIATGLARCLAVNVAVVAAFLAFALHTMIEAPKPSVERPPSDGSASAIAAGRTCWTGEAPAGQTAGHVIVTLDGDSVPRLGGKRLTERAIGQLLGEARIGHIHAFCA